jgi:uncharacterized protein GlcG (DUF336 family)
VPSGIESATEDSMSRSRRFLFSLALALTLAAARPSRAATLAERKSLTLDTPGGVVAVVDAGGDLVALERLDGTFAAGARISVGKAKTAVAFRKPTRFFEDVIRTAAPPWSRSRTSRPCRGAFRSSWTGSSSAASA